MKSPENDEAERILGLLDEGKFEQAAQATQDLFRRLRLDLGGLPVAVSALLDDLSCAGAHRQPAARAQALTRRAHARWVRGLIRLMRKEGGRDDFESSFNDLNAASCLSEEDPMAHVRLANGILFAARYVPKLRLQPCANLSTAKRELKVALRLAPDCAPAHHGLGFLRLTTAQGLRLSGGDPERAYSRAADAFAAAIAHDPTTARSHQNLGIAQAALARYRRSKGLDQGSLLSEALGHLERAVSMDPTLRRAAYKAAQILAESGQADRAGEYVEKCRLLGVGRKSRLDQIDALTWRTVEVS